MRERRARQLGQFWTRGMSGDRLVVRYPRCPRYPQTVRVPFRHCRHDGFATRGDGSSRRLRWSPPGPRQAAVPGADGCDPVITLRPPPTLASNIRSEPFALNHMSTVASATAAVFVAASLAMPAPSRALSACQTMLRGELVRADNDLALHPMFQAVPRKFLSFSLRETAKDNRMEADKRLQSLHGGQCQNDASDSVRAGDRPAEGLPARTRI